LLKIAFLGPSGTVSEQSARHFLGAFDCQFIPYRHIADVFQSTDARITDFCVVPIENTIEGSVSLHMDWIIHRLDLPIQAEWVFPSIQNLIGKRHLFDNDRPLEGIRKIYSHQMAIAQCREFLQAQLPKVDLESVHSTAEGVRLVSESEQEGLAAIGTELAATQFGLDILAANIQDHDNNYTRFILLGHKKMDDLVPTTTHKTSVLITLPEDYPGALHQVLSAFAWRRINLSRIESRPTKKKLGSYYFYIDIAETLDSVLVQAAIAEIEAIGCQIRILGSYPSYVHLEVQ
jgi:prephenate dehydratase